MQCNTSQINTVSITFSGHISEVDSGKECSTIDTRSSFSGSVPLLLHFYFYNNLIIHIFF